MVKVRFSLATGLLLALLVAVGSAGAAPPRQSPEPIIHVVRSGENLFRLSLRYDTTVAAIMAANGLTNADTIYVGQQLIIPTAAGDPPPADQPSPAGDGTYRVRPGDTLSQIARRFNTTALDLARLNAITNPSTIYAGQVLRLSGAAPAAAGAKRVVVDISEQHLYAYAGDQLVYSFVASTGAAPTYTRTGQFYVQSKIPNAYGSSWDIWMPHWLGIYWAGGSENGIHALPILPNGGTLWAGYLGTPISYGCVVLGTYEAALLYEWADLGTPVTIRP